MASRRIAAAIQPSMDKVLEEVVKTNAAAREKMVPLLNSISLTPLPISRNSSNPQVTRLTSFLPSKVVANSNKDTSAIPEDMSVVVGSEHLQSSSDALLVTHDVATVLTCSPPQECSIPDEDSKKPMHLVGDDLKRKDPTASVPTIEEENTILIKDNDSNDDSYWF